MSLPPSTRMDLAERLVADLGVAGYTFSPRDAGGVYVRPAPPAGTRLDLEMCHHELRSLVHERDRTAGALMEAAQGVGLELTVADGALVLSWPTPPTTDQLSTADARALVRLLAEHEGALVNRLRRTEGD